MKTEDFSPSAPGRLIKTLTGYYAFIPNPLPPELTWSDKLVSAVSNAERGLARLAGLTSTFTNPQSMAAAFIRQEAVLSSRIEGTQSTLQDLYTYEAYQLPLIEYKSDVKEVYNYVKALEFGLKLLDTLPVSLRFFRELHNQLIKTTAGKHLTPGEFRRSQNWIGPPGSTIETAAFVPPPVEEMQAALSDLESYINGHQSIPAALKLGLIHYQFETIHPFLDGNGRVGRLLIPLLLCAWDLLPQPFLNISIYFEKHRQRYYDLLLAVSRNGDWEDWLLFFLDGIFVQSKQAVDLIGGLSKIQTKYYQLVEHDRVADKLKNVIDFLLGQPVVSINQVVAGTSAANFNAAGRYINKLVAAGILEEMTGAARNRIFVSREIFQAIQQPVQEDGFE